MLEQSMGMRLGHLFARLVAPIAVVLGTACAAIEPPPPPSHVDLVIEDVTAMIEGMMAAHATRMVAQPAPDFRSSAPPRDKSPR